MPCCCVPANGHSSTNTSGKASLTHSCPCQFGQKVWRAHPHLTLQPCCLLTEPLAEACMHCDTLHPSATSQANPPLTASEPGNARSSDWTLQDMTCRAGDIHDHRWPICPRFSLSASQPRWPISKPKLFDAQQEGEPFHSNSLLNRVSGSRELVGCPCSAAASMLMPTSAPLGTSSSCSTDSSCKAEQLHQR